MYIFVFGEHVFVFHKKEEVKSFLTILFDHASNGRILYMTMAEVMKSWVFDEGTENLPTPIPGVDMVDTLMDSMVELYNLFGVIYDPEGSIFSVSDGKAKVM